MNEKVVKYERKIIKKYVKTLMSYMGFFDRIRFVFSGNYLKPMLRTDGKLRDRKFIKTKITKEH